jgi:predicted GNAT family acetyltransferase
MATNVRDNTERNRFELDADGHTAFSNYKRADVVLTILHTEVPKALEAAASARR